MKPNAGDYGELWSRFQATAATCAERLAVISPGVEMTFGEVREIAEHLAGALSDAGLAAGDTVHLVVPNSPVFLPALLALRRLSIAVGLVSSRYRDAEFRALTERAAPRAYLTTAPLASVLGRAVPVARTHALAIDGHPLDLQLVFLEPVTDRGSSEIRGRSRAALRGEECALIKFTSGSSGLPKGVGLSELNVVAEATNVVQTLGIGPADRILVPVPISHSYGFDLGILPVIFAGSTAILRSSFVPGDILSELAREDLAIFLGVPSMYRILTEFDVEAPPDLSHVRYLLSCTAPLLPDLIVEFHRRFKAPICQHYGSSETGAVANHLPPRVLEHPTSVGAAMRNVEVKIVGEHGEQLKTGEEGEIVIRSEAVAAGYVTDEVEGASGFFGKSDGPAMEYRTGDLGVLDAEGFLYWRGRKDHVINVGGLKVYPSEVIRVLESCPAVASAHVIGVKDQSGEQVVHALVTLSQSTREQDILAYCRKRLADYKVPRRIEIVEAIPTWESAKMRDLSGDIHL